MNMAFIPEWLETFCHQITSLDYNAILTNIWNVFGLLYDTIERLTQFDTEGSSGDAFYERQSKKEYSIYVVTWNVGAKMPPPAERIYNLLKIDEDCVTSRESHPDLYAIGLQEVGGVLNKISTGPSDESLWIQRFVDVLSVRGYVFVKSKQMQQLMLLLFVKKKYLLHLRKIETERTKTGLAGLLGNKGAVSIRLSLAGCAVCLVNCHFAADDDMEERIEDIEEVMDQHLYKDTAHPDIFEHDIVFWFGDLNCRLSRNNKLTPEETEQLISANERDKLLQMDELHYLMEDGKIFHGFVEKRPNFPPTYKFEHESPFYDLRRKPAWTDRILYKLTPNPYSNVSFQMKQDIYNSYAECNISDHRPVATEYYLKFVATSEQPAISATLHHGSTSHMNESHHSSYFDPSDRLFEDHSRYIVDFAKIPFWHLDEENIIEYTLPAGFCENASSDWIALYKSNFDDLSKYISYQYVPSYLTWNSSVPPVSSTLSLQPIRDCSNVKRKRRIHLNFAEHSVNIEENEEYVLLYFEREKSGVMGVAGVSNTFKCYKKKEDMDKKKT